MGLSQILAITELAPNQVQAFATVNDMLAALESASNETKAIDTSNPANYVLAELDFVRYFVFVLSGHTSEFDFTVPSTVNTVATNRVITVVNNEDFAVRVRTNAIGSMVDVPGNSSAIIRIVGVNVFLIASGGTGFINETLFSMWHASTATADQVLWRHPVTAPTLIDAHFKTPGVGTIVFTAQPDDTDTITINDGLKQVTFEFDSGGGVTAGNTSVTIGGSVDATAANLVVAINAANLNVTATYDTAVDTVTVRNWNGEGGSITESSGSPDFSVTTFTGGSLGAQGSINTLPTQNTYLRLMAMFRSGTVLFNAQPDDADTVTIDDGYRSVTFEFESGGGVSGSNTAVTIGADQDATALNFMYAINRSVLNVEATFNATSNTVTIVNLFANGGSITKVDGDNDLTVTDFRPSIDTFAEIGTVHITMNGNHVFRSGKRATGLVLFNAQPDDGDTLTINDGFTSITFEFESGGGVGAGNTSVTIGVDMDTTAANLVTAIQQSNLNVGAIYNTTTNLLELKNNNCTGGSITKSDGDNDYTVTDFAGGLATATKETGSIVFSAVADIGDTVTIFDGRNTTVFTFAATGNGLTGSAVNVATGSTATDSANNLRTAINNNAYINVTGGGSTTTVSVTNDNYIGGSITKSDADNDYAVTDFTGGSDPVMRLIAGNVVRVQNRDVADASAAGFALSVLGKK